MTTRDALACFAAGASYTCGTVLWRALLGHVGRRSRLHWRLNCLFPTRISVGDGCEIKHDVTLDGRSAHAPAITIGDEVRIKERSTLAAYGGFIHLGRRVLVGHGTIILGHGGVIVGDDSMISPYVIMVSSEHVASMATEPFQDQGFTRERIEIGPNVWIGGHTSVLAGTVVERDVVVGAGSVVRGVLESGWLYAGVPARQIRRVPDSFERNVEVFKRDWGLLY